MRRKQPSLDLDSGLTNLMHCIQEAKEDWPTFLGRGTGAVMMPEAERVASREPLSLNQLNEPAKINGYKTVFYLQIHQDAT